MRDRNRGSLLSLRLVLVVAWTDVVAYMRATLALFPLLARRRPVGRRSAAAAAAQPESPAERASG